MCSVKFHKEKENQRQGFFNIIIEWFVLEVTLKIISLQAPAMGRHTSY